MNNFELLSLNECYNFWIIAYKVYFWSNFFCFNFQSEVDHKTATSIYNFTVTDTHGNEVSLEKYRGNVVVIVNIASKCGLAGQYEGLMKLREMYHDKGMHIMTVGKTWKNEIFEYNILFQDYEFWHFLVINSVGKCLKAMELKWFAICKSVTLNLAISSLKWV